ncbi:MAG: hypothetical protein V4661_15550 [Pseudomonadota bacterium]
MTAFNNVSAAEFIERLADVSESFGRNAGVGAMETAGLIVSFLDEHPDWLGAFMKDGWAGLPHDFNERGSLTWMAVNGNVTHPRTARYARIVKKMATSK